MNCYHCDEPIGDDDSDICLQCHGSVHKKCVWVGCHPGVNPKGRAKPKLAKADQ